MIGLTFKNPYLLSALAAAQLCLIAGVYLKGRADAAVKCEREKRQAALQAIEEKENDDDAQAQAADAADAAIRDAVATLNRRLERTHVKTGLDCDAPGSGDSVRDAWSALFETGLPPGDASDAPRAGADAPAMETGRGPER